MTAIDRITQIQTKLQAYFKPAKLEITDDSHKHIGHPGAQSGGGHYTVLIVSQKFNGLPLLARHRLVYQALADMLLTDIHALKIIAHELA